MTTLAGDPDAQVRLEIAKLMLWQPKLHDHLVTDTEETVRAAIADHSELPDTAALILARDSSDEVRGVIARRDRLSKAVLEVLIADPNPDVRRSLAYARVDDVPTWMLEQLASDADTDVRWQVANNWLTPKDTLRRLEETDPDDEVRSRASYTLAQGWS